MRKPRTVGEAVERHGVCLAMMKIADLAHVLHRIPAGEWDYHFTSDPRWRLCLNGGPHDTWTPPDALPVARFEVYVEFNGWPAGSLNAAGGTTLGIREEELLQALDREIEAHRLEAPQ